VAAGWMALVVARPPSLNSIDLGAGMISPDTAGTPLEYGAVNGLV